MRRLEIQKEKENIDMLCSESSLEKLEISSSVEEFPLTNLLIRHSKPPFIAKQLN
jgi:hypothetical protein